MYIASTPAVGCKSMDVYHWCAYCRIQVQECISLERSLWNASPGMYNASVPMVECKSRYAYCSRACC